MSYQINFTDSVNKGFIQVDDNTVNTETSLSLPGRTKSDYGAIINENLLHLLENFANNNPPANPVEGQLWYDTTIGVDQLKVYDGTQWVSASSIKKANNRPEAVESNLGDLWVDTANQQLFLYNGNDWTLVGPEFSLGSNTGAKFEEIIDTTNVRQSVVINFVKGVPVVIISDTEFTPKLAIQGFSIIKPGINLATGTGLKYYGRAETAENLFVPGEPGTGNVLASNFARRDRDNTFTRPIRIQNNGGVNIGETPTLQLAVSGSNSIIRNLATNGDIRFRLTQGTLDTIPSPVLGSNTVLMLKSNKLVGINKDNPTEALDVEGNIKTSGSLKVDDTLEVVGTSTLKNDLTVEGNTNLRNLTAHDITPDQSGRNIGTTSLRFNNIFSQTINSNAFRGATFTGPDVNNPALFTGTLQGSSLGFNNSTVFRIRGDVESQLDISFGGPIQGSPNFDVGGVKEFDVKISANFINGQDTTTSVNQTTLDQNQNTVTIFDEILINRPGVGLRKINQNVLVSTIPAIPVGMITPYAGDTLPVDPDGKTRWLFCDGSIVSRPKYNKLYEVIGDRFDPTLTSSIDNFRLPDLRGRFPLGNTAMDNIIPPTLTNPSPAKPIDGSVVNDPESSQLGALEGSATKTIQPENLPDHQHKLEGDQGTDFYAVTNQQNAPDSGVDTLASQNITLGVGQPGSFITQTGNPIGTTGEEFSVVNPYQTVNYIIYAGDTI